MIEEEILVGNGWMKRKEKSRLSLTRGEYHRVIILALTVGILIGFMIVIAVAVTAFK